MSEDPAALGLISAWLVPIVYSWVPPSKGTWFLLFAMVATILQYLSFA